MRLVGMRFATACFFGAVALVGCGGSPVASLDASSSPSPSVFLATGPPPPQSISETQLYNHDHPSAVVERYSTRASVAKGSAVVSVSGEGVWTGSNPVQIVCYVSYGLDRRLVEGAASRPIAEPEEIFRFRGSATFDRVGAEDDADVACRAWP